MTLTYEKLTDLARDYADTDMSGFSDFIGTLCTAIYQYDGGFGDMPHKDGDLKNAAVWLLNVIINDLNYHLTYNDGDCTADKQAWLQKNQQVLNELIEEFSPVAFLGEVKD